ncbi:hypothetical protein [Crossiella sp. NPDC003009]
MNTTRVSTIATPAGRACRAWDTAAVIGGGAPANGHRMRADTQQVLAHSTGELSPRGRW